MDRKIYLCSFADTRLGISACRFKQQAEAMKVFDEIFIFTEASLPLKFREDFNDKFYSNYQQAKASGGGGSLIPTRGFGYWCWKPKVILMILEQIQENDILIFLDIGFEFNPNKHDLLLEMVAQVEENEIMGLDAGLEHCAEKYWNKADLLAHYGLLDDKEFLDSPQMIGGAIFCKKTFRVCNIIQEWLNVFMSIIILLMIVLLKYLICQHLGKIGMIRVFGILLLKGKKSKVSLQVFIGSVMKKWRYLAIGIKFISHTMLKNKKIQ